MSGVNDSFLDLEKHRLLLEDNVQQLRKALQHWQTWDAEYEALKEEVDAVPDAGSAKELQRVKGDFAGELINLKEIDEIFGRLKIKSKAQIFNVLERRIDYVTKNIESLQKQLETAENKYAAATVISQPDATDEDGQPMTEIVEELDDEDNVVSYRLNTPGQALPHVKEALDKAGVKDLLDDSEPAELVSEKAKKNEKVRARTLQPKATTQTRRPPAQSTVAPKKGVSFAEDIETEEESTPVVSRTAKRVEHIMKSAKEQESIHSDPPVVPEDEDPDDAALRQDMLNYSMGEVGAVVAELQLEEGSSDADDYDFDYSDEDDDGDDEDTYGRTKRRVVTEDYQQRMLELEQKLGIKSRFTEAADEDEDGDRDAGGSEDERIGRIVVNHNSAAVPSASKPTPTKSSLKEKQAGDIEERKGVRFAEELDIAPIDEPAAPAVRKKEDLVEPLSDVVERSTTSRTSETKIPRKPSRFKKTRDNDSANGDFIKGPLDAPSQFLDQELPTPKGPDGTTLADKLVERDSVSGPSQSGDFDSSAFHDVADEHQRLRRKFIERDGGFLKEDESPIQPLDESEGGPERMSRFKAARLSRQ